MDDGREVGVDNGRGRREGARSGKWEGKEKELRVEEGSGGRGELGVAEGREIGVEGARRRKGVGEGGSWEWKE